LSWKKARFCLTLTIYQMIDSQITDKRVKWIKDIVEKTFEVEYEQSKEVKINGIETTEFFADCLFRNENQNLQKLLNFFDDKDQSSAVLFWTEKVIQRVKIHSLQQTENLNTDPLQEKDQDLLEKAEKNLEGANNEDSSIQAQQDGFPSDESTKLQKEDNLLGFEAVTVESANDYEIIQLHLAIGLMPEQLVDTTAIFFLKNNPGPIPQPLSSGICF
jgi:hypothetical protein